MYCICTTKGRKAWHHMNTGCAGFTNGIKQCLHQRALPFLCHSAECISATAKLKCQAQRRHCLVCSVNYLIPNATRPLLIYIKTLCTVNSCQ